MKDSQTENVSYFLRPYIHSFYESNYINEILEHSRRFSSRSNCFTQQMAAQQLIIKWQRLMCV
jgi:hypothetical protein